MKTVFDTNIIVRCKKSERQSLKEYCKLHGTDMSKFIRTLFLQAIRKPIKKTSVAD